jgi:hypothetical protein
MRAERWLALWIKRLIVISEIAPVAGPPKILCHDWCSCTVECFLRQLQRILVAQPFRVEGCKGELSSENVEHAEGDFSMGKSRLEAFSDSVVAIIITIMVRYRALRGTESGRVDGR